MTLLLASVTDGEEAEIAIRHGADIIDLKDVSKAFGAVSVATVRSTVKSVARRRPVSAVIAEPDMDPAALLGAATAIADVGLSYVKVGLYPHDRRLDSIRALAPLAKRVNLIGVLFADCGADEGLIQVLAESGFAGAMLDTAYKSGGRLLDHMDITALGRFVDTVRGKGLLAGLAGSLELPDIPRLLLLAPDVLGFRRALCAGAERESHLDGEAVNAVRALIPVDARRNDTHPAASAKVDYRLLAARGYSRDSRKDDSETDLVFVRDFVLPIRIGAYAYEHEHPQNVRFNIDAKVLRPDHLAENIRDVFSYDLITDSIRMIVAQEHIALVETLAERIAAFILIHPQVTAVTVRVEKLDIGPGGIGVEIVRRRSQEVAKVHQLYPQAADPKVAT